MTPDELKELVSFGRERRHVEFKSGGSLEDKNLRTKVFRAIMAMANLRDGGVLLIGVSENGQDPATVAGVSDEQIGSWQQDDLVP